MEMISIAVYARSFLKDLEESTSGRESPRPLARPELSPSGSPGFLLRAAGAIGAVAILAAFLSLAAR
jgi:hypothetical protein